MGMLEDDITEGRIMDRIEADVASLLDVPGYIHMTTAERERAGYPSTKDEMLDLIEGRREADAILADPSLLD